MKINLLTPVHEHGHAKGDDIADGIREMYRESDVDFCHGCYDPIPKGAPRVVVPMPVSVHPSCAPVKK